MRPHFDATLIAELRRRVVTHNEGNPDSRVSLGELRKVYERGYRRSNPGARAMDRVETHLAGLAKAEGFDEHKHHRKADGEFTDGPAVLPASVAQHKKTQEQNAGYRAVTSDVIPDTRHETIGAAIRDAGSLGAGIAATAAYARSKPGGKLEQRAARVAGGITGLAAGTAATISGNTVRRATEIATKVIRRGKPLSPETVARFRKASTAVGQKVGGAVGRHATRVGAGLVQGALASAGNKFGRKAAVFGAIAGAVGLGVRSQIKDTVFDPAGIGRGIDAFSYRQIQKMAASDEIGQAHRQFTQALAKDIGHAGSIDSLSAWLSAGGGDLGELRKGYWSKLGVGLFTGAAAGIGALAGAGAGVGAKKIVEHGRKGNPYHDKGGRFTSKTQAATSTGTMLSAAGGALLGGAASGLAIYSALRRHNVRSFLKATDRLARAVRSDVSKTMQGRTSRVKAFAATREKRIGELVDSHPSLKKHRAQVAELKAQGASSEAYIQAHLTDAYNKRLSEILSNHPDLHLPHKGAMRRLGDLSPPGTGVATARATREREIKKALDAGVAPKDLATALRTDKSITPQQQKTILEFHKEGLDSVNAVKADIAGHLDALKTAKEKVDTLKGKRDAAAERFRNAKTKMQAAGEGEGAAAAKTEHDRASTASDRAYKAHEKAESELESLKGNPQGVINKLTGKPVPPQNPYDVERSIEKVNRDAREKAGELFDGEFEAFKSDQVRKLSDRYNRILAAQAVRGTVAGAAPKHVARETSTLGFFKRKFDEAGRAVTEKELAHAPNQRDLADLAQAESKRAAPGVTPIDKARRADVLGRAADIRTNHAKTLAELEGAHQSHAEAAVEMHAEARALSAALAAPPTEKKVFARAGSFLPPELKRDLRRAQDGMASEAKAFLQRPSGKKLKALYQSGVSAGMRAKNEAVDKGKKIGMGVYNDFLTREVDGKRVFSPRKAIVYGPLAAGAAGGLVQDAFAAKDLVFGSPEQKKAAKARRNNIRVEGPDETDPITGAGYIAVTAPHPTIKGERVLLWGERTASDTAAPVRLHGGTTMSSVRSRTKELNARVQQQAAVSLGIVNPELKMSDETRKALNDGHEQLVKDKHLRSFQTFQGGPDFKFRSDESQLEAPAGKMINEIRGVTGEGSLSGDPYHRALEAVFSKQGEVLKAKQAYRHLTGFTDRGEAANAKPIFKANDGFKSQEPDEVMTALKGEVDRVLPSLVTPSSKANLHRAIGTVGLVKKLPRDQLAPLYEKVRASVAPAPTSKPEAAPSQATPAAAKPPSTALVKQPEVELSSSIGEKALTPEFQKTWDQKLAHPLAGNAAKILGPKIGLADPDSISGLQGFLHHAAKEVHQEFRLGEKKSVNVAANALNTLIDKHAPDAVIQMISRSDGEFDKAFIRELTRRGVHAKVEADRENMGKAILLDDLDALVKASFGEFVEALHPRMPSGSAGGGEFAAASGHQSSVGTKVAGEVVEAGSKRVGLGGHEKPGEQAWNHPVRLGAELGSALGGEAAMRTVSALLPEPVRLLAQVGHFAAGGVAAVAGSALGGAGGEAAGNAVLRARGQRAQAYKPPEEPPKEGLSGAGGALVGTVAGEALGAIAGTPLGPAGIFAGKFLGGSLGGYAGDYAGRAVYRYFGGFDAPAVNKAMNRYAGKGAA